MALIDPAPPAEVPQAGPSSPTGSSRPSTSFELPSLQPLSHTNPYLSADDFDADAFLLTRAHIPLEELRGELREYLSQLREELVQLINDDYEEFISLGTGLRGEEERLIRLGKPLSQIKEEVTSVRDSLAEQQVVVQDKLDQRAALREEKALLDLLQRLFDTLSRAESLLTESGPSPQDEELDRAKVVDRLASEYTQLKYLMEKAQAESCRIVDAITPRIDKIKSSISRDLSSLLMDALRDQSITHLRQCFRTYDLISSLPEAGEVIRKDFEAFCKQTIVLPATGPNSPVVPVTPHQSMNGNPFDRSRLLEGGGPLADILNKVLVHVDDLRPLLVTADEVGFDVFSQILWPCASTAIVDNLGNTIFAAGRPDELHKHFTLIHRFISLFEAMAPSVDSIHAMRETQEYISFERRWQLPVYFQLRWKEIVGTYEAALAQSTPSDGWALGQSAAAWKALSTCWSSNVFIPELAPRFWRLSLQIIARLASWLRNTVDSFVITEEDVSQEEAALKMAASGLVDSNLFLGKIADLPLPAGLSLQEHASLPTQLLEDKIVSIITRRCVEPLKLVRSVASQFRAAPSKSSTNTVASYYVPTVLKPLLALYSSRPSLRTTYGDAWSARVAEAVFVNYASILASVRKTEDLLRRHRKSKKNTFSLFGGGGGGGGASGKDEVEAEEERFKKQMMTDAEALRKDAEGLGVNVAESAGYKELVDVINRPAE